MTKIITFYNHKGGVSKTTTNFNIAYYLSQFENKKVLVIDADPQCNITELLLTNIIKQLDEESEKTGNIIELPGTSLLDILIPRIEGETASVDISKINLIEVKHNLFLIKGDVALSKIEDALAESYIQRYSSKIHEKRNYVAFYDFTRRLGEYKQFDYIFIDVGPSSGALTRTCVLACDGFFIPVNPDRFSIQAIKTLSEILTKWLEDHIGIVSDFEKLSLPIKATLPRLLGVIPQLYKKYKGKPKPGYKLWMKRLPETIFEKLIPALSSVDISTVTKLTLDNIIVTEISDFQSLAPCSQEVGKPIFDLTQEDIKNITEDGKSWTGIAWTGAQNRMEEFKGNFRVIWERIQWI